MEEKTQLDILPCILAMDFMVFLIHLLARLTQYTLLQ